MPRIDTKLYDTDGAQTLRRPPACAAARACARLNANAQNAPSTHMPNATTTGAVAIEVELITLLCAAAISLAPSPPAPDARARPRGQRCVLRAQCRLIVRCQCRALARCAIASSSTLAPPAGLSCARRAVSGHAADETINAATSPRRRAVFSLAQRVEHRVAPPRANARALPGRRKSKDASDRAWSPVVGTASAPRFA